MTTQRISEAFKVCRRLVIRLRGAARRRGRTAAPPDVLDLRGLQLALADELEAMRAGLESWDRRCECECERGDGLRRRRDDLAFALRSRLLRLKNGLSGAFDDRTARQLLQPVRQLADAPRALQWQAEELHATLADPALELPPPRPGVEVDLALAAESLERPKAELGQTLAALTDCEAAVRHARARRDEERERLEDLSGKVGRFDRALRALAGHGLSSPLGRPAARF